MKVKCFTYCKLSVWHEAITSLETLHNIFFFVDSNLITAAFCVSVLTPKREYEPVTHRVPIYTVYTDVHGTVSAAII